MAIEMETLTVSISSGLMGVLGSLAGVWLKSRVTQKTTVENQPLVVKGADTFVLKTDFEKHIVDFSEHVKLDNDIHKELFTLDREREKGNSEQFKGIARQLGTIEGKLDTALEKRK